MTQRKPDTGLETQLAPAPQDASGPKREVLSPGVKMALELGPLAIFFAANQFWGIFPATAILMVAVTTALAINYWLEKKLPVMPIVTAVTVLVFGGLTLILHDELFIKIKPTIVNLLFASGLLGGLLFGRLLIKLVMGQALQLPDFAWRSLTYRVAAMFVFLACVNEYVWRTQSTDFWVAFKVWGVFPITMLWMAAQTPYILKHQIEPEADKKDAIK
jgi:intracellular septation protein